MPQLSPDGRWLAYTSDQSGRYEIYVREFPSAQGLVRVSSAGGTDPRWRADGRELYYLEPQKAAGQAKLMAASVGSARVGAFDAAAPRPLSGVLKPVGRAPIFDSFSYDVASESRFLFLLLEGDSPTLDILTDWRRIAGHAGN